MNAMVLKELNYARMLFAEASEKRKKALKLFEESPDYQALLQAENEYKESVFVREKELRRVALEEYHLTANKNGLGYSIKVMTEVEIKDEKKAFEWCLSNFTPSLKLDTKTFKTAAKNGTVPSELADVFEEAKVYIDSDLSKFDE